MIEQDIRVGYEGMDIRIPVPTFPVLEYAEFEFLEKKDEEISVPKKSGKNKQSLDKNV